MAAPHPHPTTGPVRLVRGVLVGAGGASVSLLAHMAAGGEVPAAGTTAVAFLGAAGLCWWLSDRRWTSSRLVGALLVVQSALHLLLAGSAHHHATPLMLVAHVGATALTARLLLTGESWVWDLLDALCLRVARRVRPVPTAPPAGPLSPPAEWALALRDLFLRLPWRRGPPAPLAAS
jgi:hypothetical protein